MTYSVFIRQSPVACPHLDIPPHRRSGPRALVVLATLRTHIRTLALAMKGAQQAINTEASIASADAHVKEAAVESSRRGLCSILNVCSDSSNPNRASVPINRKAHAGLRNVMVLIEQLL